ncbi:MAG: DUF1801 domain-containing protein [Brumimicrobium sp.]|nr:DUF1801 domain-containing protein [Brumimicrobium sp.]
MEKNKYWPNEIEKLKKILDKTELEEKTKWGIPVYTFKNKNVVGVVGFKSYFGLWFYKGALLDDKKELLHNSLEENNKAIRQMRFTSADQIDEKIVLDYVNEAISNEKEGLEVVMEKKDIQIPHLLRETLENEPKLKEAFAEFPKYKQNEFMDYISSAKLERTKRERINKISQMILAGMGLNDKYLR